ncbi:MAG: FAD-binding protein [Crocinitomicaceae bacterium]
MNKTVLLKKINEVQKEWADGIVKIGMAYKQGGRKEVEKRTEGMLNKLYDFSENHILFKPTKAEEEPFRFNYDQTVSYFIGGEIEEDKGFALTPWKKVTFDQIEEINIIEQDCDVLVMGSYVFTDYHGEQATVEYTFGYRGEDLRIFLHHSSLPFELEDVYDDLKLSAKKQLALSGFNVILPKDFDYDKAREISNSYFDHKPKAIAFPKAVQQVAFSIKELNRKNAMRAPDKQIPLRIMSGGHQHEGMSSADGAVIIRLSELGTIDYNQEKTQAWIPPGTKLGAAHDELAHYHKMIPGGGCMNVNVGGLTQGGGWGMNARLYGLTCDNILAAELVLANGDIVQVSEQICPDLFWAIRGGGGGNFGVITRFLFKLQEISPQISTFQFCWEHSEMENAIETYLKEQTQFPKELTSFLRVTAVPEPVDGKYDNNYPVYASGVFHGSVDKLIEILKPLHDETKPHSPRYYLKSLQGYKNDDIEKARKFVEKLFGVTKSREESKVESSTYSLKQLLNYDVFHKLFDIDGRIKDKNNCLVAPPESNCSAPHPHKVSSAFAKAKTGESHEAYCKRVAQNVTKYFQNSIEGDYKRHLPFVRSYMSIHSMGGAMSNEPEGGSAFAFRNTEFLLQFQSWWNYPTDKNIASCQKKKEWQQDYIDWVVNFRKALANEELVEGAFINFIDKEVELREYYGANFEKLKQVKTAYDAKNVFNFPMSIPQMN